LREGKMLDYVKFGVEVIRSLALLALVIGTIGTCVFVVLVGLGLIQFIRDGMPSKFGLQKLVGMVLVATVVSVVFLVIFFLGSRLWALFGPMIIH
jgi:hypothetical protein